MRPDLGCQVSKGKSMLGGAKNAVLIDVCENSVFSPGSSAGAVNNQMEARAQPNTDGTLRGVGATPKQPRGHMQGWESSSDSSIPSALGRGCQKVVSHQGPEMVTLSPFPSTFSLSALSRHRATEQSSCSSYPSYCGGVSVSFSGFRQC